MSRQKPPTTGPKDLLGRTLTRRELLRAGPAAAVIALGCDAGAPTLRPQTISTGNISGKIVGASHQTGHRLRKGTFPSPKHTQEAKIVIVGGGIAGLSAGWKLSRSGVRDFVLLELEPTAGGNARWGENHVSAYPWGAHYLPVPTAESTAVRELLDEMGLIKGYGQDNKPIYDPRHLCHAPQERLFINGLWQEGLSARGLLPPDGTSMATELTAFEAQIDWYRNYRDRHGRRAFALPVAASTTDAEITALDQLSMAEYFDRAGWSSSRLRWYVDYCCRDDYGCTLDTTSAWAAWLYFCSRPEDVEYLTWPEGNGRIVRHLMGRLSPHVRTNMLVYRLGQNSDPSDTTARAVSVDAIDTNTETAVRYRADHVIYALPRFTTRYLIKDHAFPRLDEFTYSPWVVANLTVNRLPSGAAWDNVLFDSPSLGYVVATHQNLRTTPGSSVLTYYLPLTVPNPDIARTWMLEQNWNDWVSLILADLGRAHPEIESLVTNIDVMLWGHGMIRPVVGFVWGAVLHQNRARHGRIHFAHSDMSGISVFEEAQYQGVRAAEEVMRTIGHAHTSSLSVD